MLQLQHIKRGEIIIDNIETIELVIDDNVLYRYNDFYFKNHPRASVKPILKPFHPSINQWMIMQRQSMNALKQKWKDFMVWFIDDCGYSNYGIDECVIQFTTYFKTKARHDADNYCPKFILDGLVLSGFITDDDSKHLLSLILKCDYDKEYPRTEIKVWVYRK